VAGDACMTAHRGSLAQSRHWQHSSVR
jgi:hypothetical protein